MRGEEEGHRAAGAGAGTEQEVCSVAADSGVLRGGAKAQEECSKEEQKHQRSTLRRSKSIRGAEEQRRKTVMKQRRRTRSAGSWGREGGREGGGREGA